MTKPPQGVGTQGKSKELLIVPEMISNGRKWKAPPIVSGV